MLWRCFQDPVGASVLRALAGLPQGVMAAQAPGVITGGNPSTSPPLHHAPADSLATECDITVSGVTPARAGLPQVALVNPVLATPPALRMDEEQHQGAPLDASKPTDGHQDINKIVRNHKVKKIYIPKLGSWTLWTHLLLEYLGFIFLLLNYIRLVWDFILD